MSERFIAGNSNYKSWVTLGIDRVDSATDTGNVLVYITTEPIAGGGFFIGNKTVRVTRNGGQTKTFDIDPGRNEASGALVPVEPGDSLHVELDHAGDTHSVTASIPTLPSPDPAGDSSSDPAGDSSSDPAGDSSSTSSPDTSQTATQLSLGVVGLVLAVLGVLFGGSS